MPRKDEFRRNLRKFSGRKLDKPEYFSGFLGIRTGGEDIVEVPGRNGFVWVRLRNVQNEVIQARNESVSPVYNLPVLVTRTSESSRYYTIVGRDVQRYIDWGSSSTYPVSHANQHSFRDGGGGDVVWIFDRQIMPMGISPSGSFGAGNVIIYEDAFYRNGAWHYVGTTGTADIIGSKPTTGVAKMVLVYVDDNDNPAILVGGNTFDASLTGLPQVLPYVPTMTGTSGVPVGGVRLVSGTSSLLWNNIYDLRTFTIGEQGA